MAFVIVMEILVKRSSVVYVGGCEVVAVGGCGSRLADGASDSILVELILLLYYVIHSIITQEGKSMSDRSSNLFSFRFILREEISIYT